MTLQFDEGLLLQTLQGMGGRFRTAFAASCAERLFPLYIDFSRRTEAGSPDVLETALRQLWLDLERDSPSLNELQSHLTLTMDVIPTEEQEPWIEQQAYAEDAAAAVAYALRSRISGEAQESVWAARRCYEAADHFATHDLSKQGIEDAPEERLAAHPRVQNELRLQAEALQMLEPGRIGSGSEKDVLRSIKEWSVLNRYAVE